MHHNQRELTVHLADEAATRRLGSVLATRMEPGMRIYLSGDLGAGKTTLVRALLQALGHEGRVKSPSYALVEAYVISRLYLYHFDFYRFHDPNEWNDLGFREYFSGAAVCLVEWPEKAGALLPAADLEILLSANGLGRIARLCAGNELGERCISDLRSPEKFS